MAASDPFGDPKSSWQEKLQAIREALKGLRESAVLLVMRRDQLRQDQDRLERLIADLEAKAALAERINNPVLAAELREERRRREEERLRLKPLVAQAETEAEIAKTQLPAQEATLSQRIQALQAEMAARQSIRTESGVSQNDADELWNRATSKLESLQSKAAARQEISDAASGHTGPVDPLTAQFAAAEQSAAQMLAELEAKAGIGEPPAAPASPGRPTHFLEFDAPPSSAGVAAPLPAQAPLPATPATDSAPPATDVAVPSPVQQPAPASVSESGAPEAFDSGLFLPSREAMPPPPSALTPQAAMVEQAVPTELTALPVAVRGASEERTADLRASGEMVIPETVGRPEQAVAREGRQLEERSPSPGFEISPAKGKSAPMKATDRVRVAAIGTGNIFRGAHLPAYPEIRNAQLVAFCDPDPQARELALGRYQTLLETRIKQARERDDIAEMERLEQDLEAVQPCEDLREVVERVKPDLVDICTQPVLHTPLAIQALEAGIHVMCEKPISRAWLETERLRETILRTGRFYQHNENWLYDKDYYTARKLVSSGAIGEPILMFLATAHGGPEGNPKFWNSDIGGGGALLDNGIHAIGAAWYISGMEKRPTLVKASDPFGMSIRMPDRIIDGRYQRIQVEDDAHILIRFEDPETGAWASAHVEGSWSFRDSPDTVIYGSTGRIEFVSEENRRYAVVWDAYGNSVRRIETSGPTWQPWPSSFYGEIQNMVECVRHNTPPLCSADFGADCSAIVGAAYLSEKNSRRAVSLDEFREFAREIGARYSDDPAGANDALVEVLLSAVRK